MAAGEAGWSNCRRFAVLTLIVGSAKLGSMEDQPPPDSAVTPYPLALIICDQIYREPTTGKPSLLGCFSVINATKFPATQPLITVYAAITDGRGRVQVKLRLVDVDEEREPVFEVTSEVEFTDPRSVQEMICALAGMTFPEPGEYRLQLLANDEPILERRIVLNEIGDEGESDD